MTTKQMTGTQAAQIMDAVLDIIAKMEIVITTVDGRERFARNISEVEAICATLERSDFKIMADVGRIAIARMQKLLIAAQSRAALEAHVNAEAEAVAKAEAEEHDEIASGRSAGPAVHGGARQAATIPFSTGTLADITKLADGTLDGFEASAAFLERGLAEIEERIADVDMGIYEQPIIRQIEKVKALIIERRAAERRDADARVETPPEAGVVMAEEECKAIVAHLTEVLSPAAMGPMDTARIAQAIAGVEQRTTGRSLGLYTQQITGLLASAREAIAQQGMREPDGAIPGLPALTHEEAGLTRSLVQAADIGLADAYRAVAAIKAGRVPGLLLYKVGELVKGDVTIKLKVSGIPASGGLAFVAADVEAVVE